MKICDFFFLQIMASTVAASLLPKRVSLLLNHPICRDSWEYSQKHPVLLAHLQGHTDVGCSCFLGYTPAAIGWRVLGTNQTLRSITFPSFTALLPTEVSLSTQPFKRSKALMPTKDHFRKSPHQEVVVKNYVSTCSRECEHSLLVPLSCSTLDWVPPKPL